METRVIIKDFIDADDNRRRYKYMEKYPREGYEPSKERFKALATGDNKANTVIVAEVYDDNDFERKEAKEVPTVEYAKLTKEQLQEILDQKNIEYKTNDKKDVLIELLEGE